MNRRRFCLQKGGSQERISLITIMFCISVPNFVKIGQTVAEISRFLWFSRWRPPPCWIFKNSKFLRTIPCRGPLCVTVPNFIKIGHTVAEIWRFYGFKNGGRPPSWIFEIRIFWRSGPLREPFCFSILNFVKIAAILDFQKFEILTVDPV